MPVNRDGEVDYSRYSLSELREAEASIDKSAYPQNFANLTRALKAAEATQRATPLNGPEPSSVFDQLKRALLPEYDELALSLMSVTLILIVAFDQTLLFYVADTLLEERSIRLLLALVFFVAGMILSIQHVFVSRKKSGFEKIFMLFFAVFVNAFAGLAAGSHALESSTGVLTIVPIWNIANAIFLLLAYRYDFINESHITDDNAGLLEAVVSLTLVCAIFAVCHFVFGLYWAFTFSICVAYVSNLNKLVQGAAVSLLRR